MGWDDVLILESSQFVLCLAYAVPGSPGWRPRPALARLGYLDVFSRRLACAAASKQSGYVVVSSFFFLFPPGRSVSFWFPPSLLFPSASPVWEFCGRVFQVARGPSAYHRLSIFGKVACRLCDVVPALRVGLSWTDVARRRLVSESRTTPQCDKAAQLLGRGAASPLFAHSHSHCFPMRLIRPTGGAR